MFLLFASIGFALVTSEYRAEDSSIQVSLAKQEPSLVAPGNIVEVTFKLENNGTTARDVVFEILPEFPFSLVDKSATRDIGTLFTTQDGSYSQDVKYKLRVAKDAVDGYSEIKVRYKSDDVQSWVTLTGLNIKVQTSYAILAVEKFFSTPSVAPPGDKTKLRIQLKNYATSLLKDIRVSLDLDGIPLNPVDSTNEKIVSFIDPQEKSDVDFNLLVDSDAASQAYKIPLRIEYSDLLNKNYTKDNVVTLVVGEEPDLGVNLEDTDIYTGGKGSIDIKIVNKGNIDVKFLNVKLKQSEDYKILSADEEYIGNIDSDDYETAEFDLFVNPTEESEIKLPVNLDYKDANNQDYSKNINLKLKIYSMSDAKKLGFVKRNGTFNIIIVLIIIVGLFLYWRRRRKKKLKKQ